MVGFMDNEFTFLVQVSKCISFAQLSESSRKHVYFESEKIFTNSADINTEVALWDKETWRCMLMFTSPVDD